MFHCRWLHNLATAIELLDDVNHQAEHDFYALLDGLHTRHNNHRAWILCRVIIFHWPFYHMSWVSPCELIVGYMRGNQPTRRLDFVPINATLWHTSPSSSRDISHCLVCMCSTIVITCMMTLFFSSLQQQEKVSPGVVGSNQKTDKSPRRIGNVELKSVTFWTRTIFSFQPNGICLQAWSQIPRPRAGNSVGTSWKWSKSRRRCKRISTPECWIFFLCAVWNFLDRMQTLLENTCVSKNDKDTSRRELWKDKTFTDEVEVAKWVLKNSTLFREALWLFLFFILYHEHRNKILRVEKRDRIPCT